MTKKQITLTLIEDAVKYLTDLANAQFEGNVSMAAGKVIAEHSVQINWDKGNDP